MPAAIPKPVFLPIFEEPEGMIRIVAALVNPAGSLEVEVVTLINTTPRAGQASARGHYSTPRSTGKPPRERSPPVRPKPFELCSPSPFRIRGGTITLVDESGPKVDGVVYTREQTTHPGWTIVI